MCSNEFAEIGPSDIFNCKKCGKCCKGFGGTYVSRQEIAEISRFLNIYPGQFVAGYCQMSGRKPVLAQREDGYCVFWNNVCTIHPVKPHMCRAWPFIPAILKDVENWRIMARSCAGICTDFPDQVIVKCVRDVIYKNP